MDCGSMAYAGDIAMGDSATDGTSLTTAHTGGPTVNMQCPSNDRVIPPPFDFYQQIFPPFSNVPGAVPVPDPVADIDYEGINWQDPGFAALLNQINYELASSGLGTTSQTPLGNAQLPLSTSSPTVVSTERSNPSMQTPPSHSPTDKSPQTQSRARSPDRRASDHPFSSVRADILDEANDSSWAAHNPNYPMLPVRRTNNPPPARDKGAAEDRKVKKAAISDAIKEAHAAYIKQLQDIADNHSVTLEKVTKLAFALSSYKRGRDVTLTNALIYAKAKEVNSSLPQGKKHHIRDLRSMVQNDSAMQNLSPGEQEKYKINLREHREEEGLSVRATNQAATRDYVETLDRICTELSSLAHRTGIYASLFVTRGHAYDTHVATWYGTDNVLVFWEDVLKLEPSNIAKQFELWACNQGKNIAQRNSLETMQRECQTLINGAFKQLADDRTRLVYTAFETAIKEKHGIDITGWPEGIPFTSPYNITNVEHMHCLRDALKMHQCRFIKMPPREHTVFLKELAARRRAGEAVKRARKKRADSGGTHKRKSTEKRRHKKTSSTASRARDVNNEDSEDDLDGSD